MSSPETAEVTALDISPEALAVARQNAQLNHVANRIRFIESDLLRAVSDERFDAIVSNPPYVAHSERKSLAVEVREYEPARALFAGPTGLEVYRRLVPESHPLLRSGGWLMMEIGQGQRDAVRGLLEDANWDGIEFISDLQGIPRVAMARKR